MLLKWDPEQALEHINKEKINKFLWSPSVYYETLSAANKDS